ncbi:D-ribose pyranase [Arthrobacter frigidicola]|nr:D-ribose pyranase [Arthrobacter frigidicola]
MKRGGILNPALSSAIAGLGHGHLVVIADSGLPIPATVPTVDLTLVRGIPRFTEVLRAVLAEIVVEGSIIASEAQDGVAGEWVRAEGLTPRTIPHEDLKALLPTARLVIRTGEATPYANVILSSGVDF